MVRPQSIREQPKFNSHFFLFKVLKGAEQYNVHCIRSVKNVKQISRRGYTSAVWIGRHLPGRRGRIP